MTALKTTNPLLFEEKYAFWPNRYTDFDVHWEKMKDESSQSMKARLVATGRLKVDHLGNLAEGAKIVLMSGPTNGEPIPCTTVPPLRINHISLEITFPNELMVENKHATNMFSQQFRVGKGNCLFGTDEQKANKKKFKDKQDIKKGLVTQTMFKTFLRGMQEFEAEQKERLKKDETEEDEQGSYEQGNYEEDSDDDHSGDRHHSRNSYPGRNYFQHGRHIGSPGRPYQQRFTPTSEMKDATTMAANMTIGSNSVPTEETPHKNKESLDVEVAIDKMVMEPVLRASLAGSPQVGCIFRQHGRVFYIISSPTRPLCSLHKTLGLSNQG
jgi:hypothetical protein